MRIYFRIWISRRSTDPGPHWLDQSIASIRHRSRSFSGIRFSITILIILIERSAVIFSLDFQSRPRALAACFVARRAVRLRACCVRGLQLRSPSRHTHSGTRRFSDRKLFFGKLSENGCCFFTHRLPFLENHPNFWFDDAFCTSVFLSGLCPVFWSVQLPLPR